MNRRFLILPAVLAAFASLACAAGGRAPAASTPTLIILPVESPSSMPPAVVEASASPAEVAASATAAPTETVQPAETAPPADTGLPPTEEATPTRVVAPSEPVQFEASGDVGDTLADTWEEAYSLPANIPFEIAVPEQEIETQINAAVAASEGSRVIGQVDVTIQGGQMSLAWPFTYTFNSQSRTANALTIYTMSADADGHLVITMLSAQLSGALGSISIPPETLSLLNQSLSKAILQVDDETEGDVFFTSVTLEDHVMRMVGYIPPQ